MTIIITGAAGFIGFHVAKYYLLNTLHKLVLVDNFNDYYSVTLKKARQQHLHKLDSQHRLTWYSQDIINEKALADIFTIHQPRIVIHLAAQAGVRYCATNPRMYVDTNVKGFDNVLHQAAVHDVKLFLYASSSSVYGDSSPVPFREDYETVQPVSLYAKTKYHNERTAKLYDEATLMTTIGMRLFNVYGEWGRPDMAYFKWTNALVGDDVVTIFGDGSMRRDMTYISDVTESIYRLSAYGLRHPSPSTRVFNIGNSQPVKIMNVLQTLENITGRQAHIVFEPKNEIEVDVTWADCSLLQEHIGFAPETTLETGLRHFIEWHALYARPLGLVTQFSNSVVYCQTEAVMKTRQ